MAQIYFLSIIANIVAGLTLAGDYLGERIAFLAPFKDLRANRVAVTIVAALALVVGILKLIVLSPGETVPFAGDLLPGLAGIVMGGLLAVEAYRPQAAVQGEAIERISKTVLTYRVPLGIAGVAIAIAQFLFPGVIIL